MVAKKIVSLVLLSSLAGFAAYGMEMPEDFTVDQFIEQLDTVHNESMSDVMSNIVDSVVTDEFDAINKIILSRREDTDEFFDDEEAAVAIKQLLDNGIKDEKGESAVIKQYGGALLETELFASDTGEVEIVKLLLRYGTDMYGKCSLEFDSTCNFFEQAIFTGDMGLVRCFLEKGYDVKHKGYEGRTALSYALKEMPVLKIIKLLLQHGANPEDFKGHSLADIYSFLLSRERFEGLYPNIRFSEGKDEANDLTLFCKYGADINKPDKEGNTALKLAIRDGKLAVVDMLIKCPEIDIPASYMDYAQQVLSESAEKFTVVCAEGTQEVDAIPAYQKIIQILTDELKKRAAELKKKEGLLSIGPRYNEALFNDTYDNANAASNCKKIQQLSYVLMRDQNDRDLSPYITVRAPRLLDFCEHVKNNPHHDTYYAASKKTKK
jgi:ankyrin repeat protein